MAPWRTPLCLLVIYLSFLSIAGGATVVHVEVIRKPSSPDVPLFREAPAFRNGDECSSDDKVHVAMTLDANYLRGTMAAVLSILKHTSCPENVAFHFLSARYEPEIFSSIRSTFPYLNFKVYRFDSGRVRGKISKSIRQALDQPLNYARIYLPHILPYDVTRIIYLDSDLVLVDDIGKLWGVELDGKVVGAPKYCHANFTKYFTKAFWADPKLAGTFRGRSGHPCYFNTGVMVLEVEKWRAGGYTRRVEGWMMVQKQKKNISVGVFASYWLWPGRSRRWITGGTSMVLEGTTWKGGAGSCTQVPLACCFGVERGSHGCGWTPYDLYRSSSYSVEG